MASEVLPQLFTTAQPTSTGISSTQSPASAQFGDKNDLSGLNAILGIGGQVAQIGSAIASQRQQSGASANRQARIAKCGRRPLLSKKKKKKYRKCVAELNASLNAPPIDYTQSDVNKNIVTTQGSSTMKFVWIGLGVLAVGTIAFFALRKK